MNYEMGEIRVRGSGVFNDGWTRKVTFGDGRVFFVGVDRGKAVRIAFKPRGQNRGYWWWGFVRDERGRDVWSARVSKNLGVRGLLRRAGLIETPAEQDGESGVALG